MNFFNRISYSTASDGSSDRSGMRRPKLGFALSAGSARGWAHIGMLRALDEHGIRPDFIAGASIGAVVGGCYAAGKLDELEEFARALTKRRMFSLVDLTFSGAGMISGGRLRSKLDDSLGGIKIQDLETPFTAVATEMGSGHEVWLDRGPLATATQASYALPSVFEPVKINGRWLFDGALVNPIPVSVCRARGAETVIVLNLNNELRRPAYTDDALTGEVMQEEDNAIKIDPEKPSASIAVPTLRERIRFFRRQSAPAPNAPPGIITAMVDAFNITQDRITRSRLAGDPPDIMINPKLGSIGFFDFHRAAEMIEIGRDTAEKAIPEIEEMLAINMREAT